MMMMGTPIVREAKTLKGILKYFSKALGTSINESKSQIFFFNTPYKVQLNISIILWFQWTPLQDKYLKVPLIEKYLKQANRSDLVSSLESRLTS